MILNPAKRAQHFVKLEWMDGLICNITKECQMRVNGMLSVNIVRKHSLRWLYVPFTQNEKHLEHLHDTATCVMFVFFVMDLKKI